MDDARPAPAVWDTDWARNLLVHIRRQGVPAHEARLTGEGVVSISFEPGLAQAEILEGILRAWPGVAAVVHVGDRVVRARREAPPPLRRRRPRPRPASR